MDDQDIPADPATSRSFPPAATAAQERDARCQPPGEYADEYPAYLRLVQDIPTTTAFNLAEDKLFHLPPGSKDSGWQNCLNSVEKYDRELCQGYREQIDTLLVFAGLFSAVVTAFAVESYQWLQDDPIDTSVVLLREVVILLSQNVNLTVTPTSTGVQRLSSSAVARINSFWFLSLTLSLSAALVGILCKQWLREFERNVGQSPETALAVRYIRFQGLEYWNVGSIVASVPIIMQMALAFFIIGVIELLWRLHIVVACCVTVTAGLTLAFYMATTILPVVQYAYVCVRCCVKPFRTDDYPLKRAFTEPQCAFKSAQAWLALRFARPIIERILKAFGYSFSSPSHLPDRISNYVLRTADSWVDFDLNWVKCRQNVHVGPQCAFECLRWVAANLGEMHLSSGIWHCVWARWLKNRDFPDDIIQAAVEIGAVARSYPRMVALGDNHTILARTQALIFQCSLRSDLPADTALELLLRVAPVSGAGSQWTPDALHAVRVAYREQSIRPSDDVAFGLFSLANAQIHTLLYAEDAPDSSARMNAALGFRDVAGILRGARLFRNTLMPAMCGLALQWLRSIPHPRIARAARVFFEDMIQYLESQGYYGPRLKNLRRHPGIMFTAKLAATVMRLWPDEPDMYRRHPSDLAIFLELLAIHSDGFPELEQDASDARAEQRQGSRGGADDEGSNPLTPNNNASAPAGEETQVEPREQVTHVGEMSNPPSQAHIRIDVHMDPSTDLITAGGGLDSPTSPGANPVAPASPTHGPASAGSSPPMAMGVIP